MIINKDYNGIIGETENSYIIDTIITNEDVVIMLDKTLFVKGDFKANNIISNCPIETTGDIDSNNEIIINEEIKTYGESSLISAKNNIIADNIKALNGSVVSYFGSIISDMDIEAKDEIKAENLIVAKGSILCNEELFGSDIFSVSYIDIENGVLKAKEQVATQEDIFCSDFNGYYNPKIKKYDNLSSQDFEHKLQIAMEKHKVNSDIYFNFKQYVKDIVDNIAKFSENKNECTMEDKSNYQEAAKLMRKAVINTEDALCWLDANHEDREKLHDLIGSLSDLMELYELQSAAQTKSKVKKQR